MSIKNFQFSIDNFQSTIFFLCLLILPTSQAHSFAPPGTGAAPSSQLSGNVIKNISDGEIFKKSSFTKTVQGDKETLNRDPKSFLLDLIKDAPNSDFESTRSETGEGVSIHHFRQLYKNLPVFGGESTVRVSNKEGTVILTGYIFQDIRTPVEPIYDVSTLVHIAQKVLNGGEQEGEPQLGILPADDGYRLCYKIRIIKGIAQDYIFYMNALTGGVLRAFNQVDAMRN